MARIYAVQHDSEIEKTYNAVPSARGVWGFSKLNVFCGSNNSGKSRYMRWLFLQVLKKRGSFLVDGFSEPAGWSNTKAAIGRTLQVCRQMPNTPFREGHIYNILSSIVEGNFSSEIARFMFHDESLVDELGKMIQQQPVLLQSVQKSLEQYRQDSQNEMQSTTAVYLPALRTCRSVANENSILDHINKSYFDNLNLVTVFVGRNLYNLVKSNLLGKPSDRLRVYRFEQFLARHFFENEQVSLIPREGSEEVFIRLFPERERKVSQLGDGLQQLVIMLAPLFLLDIKHVIMFIEEPELYLHPGMQRMLMRILLEDMGNKPIMPSFQIFTATHSNHILDMRIDDEHMSVYRFQKMRHHEVRDDIDPAEYEEDPKVQIHISQPGDFEILGDLGVTRSSVFLANCTIWVEGPTDRRLIQKYIDLIAHDLDEDIVEDRDYAYVLYGGSTLASWSFLDDLGPNPKYLCSDMLIVCDGDIVDNNKGNRIQKLIEKWENRRFMYYLVEKSKTRLAIV